MPDPLEQVVESHQELRIVTVDSESIELKGVFLSAEELCGTITKMKGPRHFLSSCDGGASPSRPSQAGKQVAVARSEVTSAYVFSSNWGWIEAGYSLDSYSRSAGRLRILLQDGPPLELRTWHVSADSVFGELAEKIQTGEHSAIPRDGIRSVSVRETKIGATVLVITGVTILSLVGIAALACAISGDCDIGVSY